MTIKETAAKPEFQEMIHRCSRGVDRVQGDVIRNAYQEDATDDHGVFKGTGADSATFRVKVLSKESLTSLHHIATVWTAIRPPNPVARFPSFRQRRRLTSGPIGGRYVDPIERRG